MEESPIPKVATGHQSLKRDGMEVNDKPHVVILLAGRYGERKQMRG